VTLLPPNFDRIPIFLCFVPIEIGIDIA